ncbi:SDR family NAD(P)-dependent oxidoreductase, partial [Aquimarina algicola]
RYWLPISEASSSFLSNPDQLHPLLHSNASSLSEQKYKSTYTGSELFLEDHIILGDKMLPGVAYLEMARAAGSFSLESSITQISDIKWLQPLCIKDVPTEIEIGIFEDSEGLGYEIYSGLGASELIHSQGNLSTDSFIAPSPYDISLLRSTFSDEKDASSLYSIFKDLGISYGSSFRGIDRLYYNSEACLSKLSLSKDDKYILQPGILDSALQTCLGFSLTESEMSLSVPYSIQEVTIYGDVSQTVWCYARKRSTDADKISSYDLDLLSASGSVLLSIRDFVTLPLAGIQDQGNQKSSSVAPSSSELLVYGNSWSFAPLAGSLDISDSKGLVILCGGSVSLSDKLESSLGYDVISVNASDSISFYNTLQELMQSYIGTKFPLYVTVLYRHSEYLTYGFITGLLRTAEQENPKLRCKTIGLDSLSVKALDNLSGIITSEFSSSDKEVRYFGEQREVRRLEALPLTTPSNAFSVKENGVYLITGGCGGLGQIFATHFSGTGGVQLILTGRSTESHLSDKELSSLGAVYHSCDVSDKESVFNLISDIRDTYGHLDGIIHSAGVLRDSLLLHKTMEEAYQVLAPKIFGAQYLDEATKGMDLDFMVYFSSTAGAFGNVGQSDYSSGNAWMDLYAEYRNDLLSQGKRKGLSLSINWPLWSEGGMRVDREVEKRMESQTGLQPLSTTDGITAFDVLLSQGITQGAVFYGNKERLERLMLKKESTSNHEDQTNESSVTVELREATAEYVKSLFSSVLKLPIDRIDNESSFSEYGIDSIMISKLTNRLNEFFEDIPVTLLFEHQTINSLSAYLSETYTIELFELTGLNTSREATDITLPNFDFQAFDTDQSRRKRAIGFSSKGGSLRGDTIKEDIAVIGLSGRYPGAKTLDEFWDNLKLGKDAITEVPLSRWNAAELYDPEKGKVGKIASKWGGFIDDVDKFDPLFFNISPRDAELMDPQERLFLQTAWETIEDAGYTLDQLAKVGRSDSAGLGGHVGVYAGVMYGEYQMFGAEETLKGNPMATWCSPSSIANRVSFCLNLHGPSMGVDTMCSSSLVSIHLAIDAIHNGLCSMAIAGGVNVSIHPNKYKNLSQSMFVSDKGRCESFGEGGNGYVPSEGVGAVLLKPLSQAEADGDQIYGVIKGSSLNHGGRANGYTVPNPTAQASVIQEAIARAGVSPNDFSYIEAHGTGTSLGDPIEIAGLSKAFSGSKEGQYCAIGSIKSNIGHAESAAGISGLTKVLLQLKHQQLVPSLHSQTLNPNIDFTKTPFKVQQELEDWVTEKDSPRLAGISAFGAGGSNAHLIIEEYIPGEKLVYQSNDPAIIVLSAKDKDRLKEQVENLYAYVEDHKDINIYDLSYTLQVGREPMEERLAFVTDNLAQLKRNLSGYNSEEQPDLFIGNVKKEVSSFSLTEDASETYVKAAISKHQYAALAQLWVSGLSIDWELLYSHEQPKRVSLPTYPFAKERYWLPISEASSSFLSNPDQLHPLLHSNASSLSEQKYKSTYTGS